MLAPRSGAQHRYEELQIRTGARNENVSSVSAGKPTFFLPVAAAPAVPAAAPAPAPIRAPPPPPATAPSAAPKPAPPPISNPLRFLWPVPARLAAQAAISFPLPLP